jgi:uroporphyrinogen-III synthase
MKALVTRPREDADEIAAALRARGWEPVIEPMFEIRFAEGAAETLAPMLEGAGAVLFTSANGVRAFARASARRDIEAFAVGDATAKAAREAGFTSVASAGGDVGDLARVVRERVEPPQPLVHAAARESAGDLATALPGFELRRAVLYEAAPAERLSDATASALRAGEIGLAVFFSPRTAAIFRRLVESAGVTRGLAKADAAALSSAVAAELKPLKWRRVLVAPSPNQAALLAAIDGAVPPRQRRSRGFAWAIAAIVVLLLAAGGTAPYWAPPLLPLLPWGGATGGNQPAQVASLQARLDAAEVRLSQLEARAKAPAPQPARAPAPQDMAALNALAERVTALEQRPTPAGPAVSSDDIAALKDATQKVSDRVDAAETQLAKLQSMQSSANIGDVRLLAALANLRAAVTASAPYRDALDAAMVLGDDNLKRDLEPLAADAGSGLPSMALLDETFRTETAPAILRAAEPQPPAVAENGGLGERVLAKLKSLVRIRRVGEAPPAEDHAKASVAAAREALGKGDLAGAVDALQALAGPASDAAKPFLDMAERRLAAEKALAAASQDVAQRFAAPQKATP